MTNFRLKQEQKNIDRRERKGALLKALKISAIKTKKYAFFFLLAVSSGFWTKLCGPPLLPLSFHFVLPQAIIEPMVWSLIAEWSAPLHQSISRQLGRQIYTSQMYRVLPPPHAGSVREGLKPSTSPLHFSAEAAWWQLSLYGWV